MKHPSIIRPIKLTTTFPEDIRAKLDIHLYSKVENRVPQGAIQKFLIDRIREYFAQREPGLKPEELEDIDMIDPGKIMEKTFVGPRDGKVVVQFPTARKGLSMRPEAALQFASALIQASKDI